MPARTGLQIIAAPLFVALWSTGFVGAKYGLPFAEPMTFLTLRFALAAALLGAWAAGAREFRGFSDWGGAAAVGALIHAIYLGGVFTAIWLGAGAALAALVVGLQPIVTALLAGVMLGERLSIRQWIGMAMGFSGVTLVVVRRLELGGLSVEALALLIVGLVAIALGSILQKRRNVAANVVADNAVQFAAAAMVVGVAALLFETMEIDWTTEFVLALSWMTIALSLGAVSLLYLLIRRGGASETASLFFLVPGVTALLAWAMFGEVFGWTELVGVAVASAGVWLVTRVRPA